MIAANLILLVGALCLVSDLPAQPVASRPLGDPIASVITDASSISQVLSTGGGRLLLNDPVGRRIVLLDTTLRFTRVVLDSVATGNTSYGQTGAILAPFQADSALFFNKATAVLVVLGPAGEVARVAAAFGAGRSTIRSMQYSAGRGIIWNRQLPVLTLPTNVKRPREGEPDIEIALDDSSIVLAEHIGSRRLDTLRKLSTGMANIRVIGPATNRATIRSAVFPYIDEIVVMTDGTAALFRSRDCRIEWLVPGGSTASRLPCEWQRVTDADRARLVDSLAAIRVMVFQRLLQRWLTDSVAAVAAGREGPTIAVTSVVDGVTLTRNRPVARPVPPSPPRPGEIPDFLPATGRNAVFADSDNRVWIRFNSRAGSSRGAVEGFDIFDRQGRLVDRVALPTDRAIVGFSPGRVYLSSYVDGRWRLEAYATR